MGILTKASRNRVVQSRNKLEKVKEGVPLEDLHDELCSVETMLELVVEQVESDKEEGERVPYELKSAHNQLAQGFGNEGTTWGKALSVLSSVQLAWGRLNKYIEHNIPGEE